MFQKPFYKNPELICPRVLSFEMFSVKQCNKMLESISKYSLHAPKRKPNSMNNYGTVLPKDEMKHLTTFVNAHTDMFEDIGQGSKLILNHAFTVRYNNGEDLALDMHTDDSDITCNVCIGKKFKGGDLAFCGQQHEQDHRKLRYIYNHKIGYAVIHPGFQRHGALPLITGERINLVMWFKYIIPIPRRPYIRGASDPVCVSHTHDNDGSQSNGVNAFKHSTPFSLKILKSCADDQSQFD